MSVKVAGCDPGTSGLDVVVLDDGDVCAEASFSADDVRRDPAAPVRWVEGNGPYDLVAGPSGYGLPLIAAGRCTPEQRRLLSLVRPDDEAASGVGGFTAMVEAFCRSPVPTVFLPGVIHLPTVPAHRKVNRIDLGTADKVCVAALALTRRPGGTFCVVELGSAFTAVLAVERGRIVDGLGGTTGPMGWRSGGAWDGEAAYWLSPLTKGDLFRGGACDVADRETAEAAFCEGVVKAVASLKSCTDFVEAVVSGRLCQTEPALADRVRRALTPVVEVMDSWSLKGSKAKHAAQGAAVIADGLAGGRWSALVAGLRLREAGGTALDHLWRR